MEKLEGEGGRVDLYRMGGDLVLELDDLLPIVEAGELLGFVTVHDGDLLLTPLGRAYADASILARKAIITGRVLRLPIIAWIYETLQRDDNQRVAWEYFNDKLQADFGKAEKQLDIAISWGRHAELFVYDADTEELYLESGEGKVAEKTFALAELYEAWPVLSVQERVEGFKLLQHDDADDFFLHLKAQDKAQLTLALLPGERKLWMRLIGADEAAAVINAAPELEREGILSLLDDKTRREVKGPLDYAVEKAGGLTNSRYARLRPQMSVDEAVSFLRRDARDRAQAAYTPTLPIPKNRPLGVGAFRDLLITPGDKKVQDVMRADMITAPEHLDEKALRDFFIRHNLQIIPVVDSEKRMKTVVTRDEIEDGGQG